MLHVWNLYHYDRCHQNNHYTDKMLSDEAELFHTYLDHEPVFAPYIHEGYEDICPGIFLQHEK